MGIQCFLKLTFASKWSTPCERVWKTVPQNGVFSCVPFCLRSLGISARCGLLRALTKWVSKTRCLFPDQNGPLLSISSVLYKKSANGNIEIYLQSYFYPYSEFNKFRI